MVFILVKLQVASWIVALIIVVLNGKLVYDEIQGWLENSDNPIVLWLTVVPLALSFLVLLLYIVFKPFITKSRDTFHNHSPHNLQLRFHSQKRTTKKTLPSQSIFLMLTKWR
jgi:manganese transport protein